MSEEGDSECPVCYEKVSRQNQSLRTLTCNHIFCHDCLVKTVINQESQPRKVICPVCRHVTFLNKKTVSWIAKGREGKQTLEIPLSPTSLELSSVPLEPLGTPPPPLQRSLLHRLLGSCPRTLSPARDPALGTRQVFVISGRGRPMSEEELRAPRDGVVLEYRRCRLRWVLVLLCFIIIGAVVAAILPWVTSFK
ncbi:RING finger protein 222 [Carcharodon carcharias]|uniref:RING finger protein 222 n=1 Tax=Carcharodon carcharias TaxID=13397 RepID=UPI001B7DDB8F|nr:RING finger protein 222 [Carcharodon carcharias]